MHIDERYSAGNPYCLRRLSLQAPVGRGVCGICTVEHVTLKLKLIVCIKTAGPRPSLASMSDSAVMRLQHRECVNSMSCNPTRAHAVHLHSVSFRVWCSILRMYAPLGSVVRTCLVPHTYGMVTFISQAQPLGLTSMHMMVAVKNVASTTYTNYNYSCAIMVPLSTNPSWKYSVMPHRRPVATAVQTLCSFTEGRRVCGIAS